jgi:hypothetical protein
MRRDERNREGCVRNADGLFKSCLLPEAQFACFDDYPSNLIKVPEPLRVRGFFISIAVRESAKASRNNSFPRSDEHAQSRTSRSDSAVKQA